MSTYRGHVLAGEVRTLPRRYYTSAEVLEREWTRLFHDAWVCVGREEQLAAAGDFLAVDLGVESLLVVRAADGRRRAFHNVCRHRGTRLCSEESGRFPGSIQCPYHAWTYGLDGRLLGAPHMAEADWFDRAAYPLREALVDSWNGFLFLHLGDQPPPLEAWLSPLGGKFTARGLDRLRPFRRVAYDVAANWKLLFQNFSECYHCPRIHPELNRLSHYQSGANDLVEGPLLGGYMVLDDPSGSLTLSGRPALPAAARATGEDRGRVYYYSLLPNFFLTVMPDYLMWHVLWPQAVGRTRVVCEWLFDPQAVRAPGADPEDAVELWDRTNRQDWRVCELAQAGVSSRAYEPGPYAVQESLLAAFDRAYLRALGEPPSSPLPAGERDRVRGELKEPE